MIPSATRVPVGRAAVRRARARLAALALWSAVPVLAALPSTGARAADATPPAAPAADSALAVYDGGVVYPHDFAHAWWMLTPPQRPKGDAIASRKAFLVSVVDRQMMAEAAARQHYPITAAESLEVAHLHEQLALNALFKELTKDVPPVTDADVALYRREKLEFAEVRFITFADEARARSWRSRLLAGTPFADLERAIGREGATLATADSFRTLAAEQMPDTLADILWSLRPGQLSDVLVVDGRPALAVVRSFPKRPPIALGDDIRVQLQGRAYAHVRERFRAEIAQKIGRTFDDENLQFLLAQHLKLRPRSDVDSVTGQPVIRPNLPLPYITGADTARVLARSQSGVVTIGQYLRFWERTLPFERPEVRERGSLEGAIDRVALAPALYAEAVRRGLADTPEIRAELANQREGYAVQRFYHEMFENRVKVTDAALRKFYDADPAHYDDRATVSPRLIVVDRESLADSIKAQLAQGASFVDLVKQYSIDPQTAGKEGLAGNVVRGTQENSGLEDAMFATPVGQVRGPEKTPQGWVLWRIEATNPGVKRTFDEARSMVERDFRILEADRLLSEYLTREKARRHVRIYDERVTATLGRGGPWD